jgi:CelD/BcsL family acetyltransferase involved in cellulose biosynthesis
MRSTVDALPVLHDLQPPHGCTAHPGPWGPFHSGIAREAAGHVVEPSRQPCRPRVEVVASLAELERLRPAWMALWHRARWATPFQSPDWLIPWWRHIGDGELLTIAVLDEAEGRLVGLAPLYLYAQATGERVVSRWGSRPPITSTRWRRQDGKQR